MNSWRCALFFTIGAVIGGCAYFNTFYNAETYYREGMRLKSQGQASAAGSKFDRAIEKSALVIDRWPKSRWVDDALFLIARSYYEKNDYRRAANYFERLNLLFPRSAFVPQSELYLGLALLRDGEVGKARIVLEDVKRRFAKLAAVAEFHTAVYDLEQGEIREGVDSLVAFVRRYPRSPYVKDAVNWIAEGKMQLADYEDAEKWFKRYVELEVLARRRAEAQLKIVRCRLEQGKAEEAVRMVEEGRGKYPDLDEELNLLLGKAYLMLKKNDEAVSVLSRIRGNSAVGAEAAFLIGRYFEENKDFNRAKVYYDSARLRRADSEQGVLATKRLALLRALEEDSTAGRRDSAEVKFLLAEVHNLNLEDYETALSLYQAVYDTFPQSIWAPKALFARAWITLYKKKDTTTACIELNKIVDEYPATEYATEAKKLLEKLKR
ncbi:MAG: tetratricopeptide repeat protein [bacterium]